MIGKGLIVATATLKSAGGTTLHSETVRTRRLTKDQACASAVRFLLNTYVIKNGDTINITQTMGEED